MKEEKWVVFSLRIYIHTLICMCTLRYVRIQSHIDEYLNFYLLEDNVIFTNPTLFSQANSFQIRLDELKNKVRRSVFRSCISSVCLRIYTKF